MSSFELRVFRFICGANKIGSVFGIHVLYARSKVNKRQMTLNHSFGRIVARCDVILGELLGLYLVLFR